MTHAPECINTRLTTVSNCAALTTESFGRADSCAFMRVLPGARASLGLDVSTQAMTVEMRRSLNGLVRGEGAEIRSYCVKSDAVGHAVVKSVPLGGA